MGGWDWHVSPLAGFDEATAMGTDVVCSGLGAFLAGLVGGVATGGVGGVLRGLGGAGGVHVERNETLSRIEAMV